MCGRYFLAEKQSERLLNILAGMDGHPMAGMVQLGEVFPSQMAPVIVNDNGVARVRPMKWGFPFGSGGKVVINSRSEKSDYTPMFQKAVRERRCLIPVSGYYEWRRTASGGKTKDKFAVVSKGGQEKGMMYLAGVWGEFQGGFANGGFDAFAVLTRDADEQIRPYHNRMPVVLDDENLKKLWLFAPPEMPYQELRRQFEFPELYVDAVEQKPAPQQLDMMDDGFADLQPQEMK